jgi:hypothetical protein
MADPILNYGDLIEKVGLALATIVGLVLVLKWLSQLHLKALTDRIATLEIVVKEKDALIEKREKRIDDLQSQILSATISHAHDIKALVLQLLDNDKANREFLRAHQAIVIKLVEQVSIRPCMAEDYRPHPAAKPDLPPVPATDRNQKHG